MTKSRYAILFLAFLLSVFLFVGTASADVSFTVSFDKQFSGIGETFNITMYAYPGSNPVSGIQSNFIFNPSVIKVNGIYEGNLLSENGNYSTFFNTGIINNKNGTINNTFDAIIGKHTVTKPGTFVILSITTIGYGTTFLNPTNVKVASDEATPVPYDILILNSLRVTKFGYITGKVTS